MFRQERVPDQEGRDRRRRSAAWCIATVNLQACAWRASLVRPDTVHRSRLTHNIAAGVFRVAMDAGGRAGEKSMPVSCLLPTSAWTKSVWS
jgi:hypothetical protein